MILGLPLRPKAVYLGQPAGELNKPTGLPALLTARGYGAVETTLTMLQSRLQRVVITREYEPNLPIISAYGSELNQVWMVLLENALDAIKNRGHISLRVRRASDLVLVEIEDDGPGIPKELQARIFEPFFTTKAPGHGLGLSLDTAQRIVRMHRGYLTVLSLPGKTCFKVGLPLQQTGAY